MIGCETVVICTRLSAVLARSAVQLVCVLDYVRQKPQLQLSLHHSQALCWSQGLSTVLALSSSSICAVLQQAPPAAVQVAAHMSKPLPDFAKKQADDISKQKTAELKQHATACFAKYFTGEALQGRGQIYQHEQDIASGTVKSNNQHPLLSFLATPKLPPELAAYLELK